MMNQKMLEALKDKQGLNEKKKKKKVAVESIKEKIS